MCAFEIKARGTAVGEAFTPSPERSRAVMRVSGEIIDLGTLPGASGAVANDINARVQVTGHGFASIDGRAVIWHDGHAHDLNELLPPDSGWTLRSAEGINEAGPIVGYGTLDGQTRAFLLSPGA
jgi:probable HAF family extracellular repeat protein